MERFREHSCDFTDCTATSLSSARDVNVMQVDSNVLGVDNFDRVTHNTLLLFIDSDRCVRTVSSAITNTTIKKFWICEWSVCG